MMKPVTKSAGLLKRISKYQDRLLFSDLGLTFGDFSSMVEEEVQQLKDKQSSQVYTHLAPIHFSPQEIAKWSAMLVALLETEHLVCLKSLSDPYQFPSDCLEVLGAGLILKTSGSTSRPKLVYHPISNIALACERFYQFYGERTLTTWQLNLPLNHVGGLSLLLRALYFGLTLAINEDRRVLHPKAQAISLVPTQLSHFLSFSDCPLKDFEFILIGGAPTPQGLFDKATHLNVSYSYGLTESFAAVGGTPVGQPRPAAKFFPGIQGRLVAGRLELKGPGLLHSLLYCDSEGNYQTENYEDKFYPTQDLASLDGQEHFQILGRADQVIISGAEKIDVSEVEALINTHKQLEVSKVIGVPDPKWGEALALFISPYSQELANSLTQLLKSRLGPHYAPKYILPHHKVTHQGIKPSKKDFIAAVKAL